MTALVSPPHTPWLLALTLSLQGAAYASPASWASMASLPSSSSGPPATAVSTPTVPAPAATSIFAGGSFWCLEAAFEALPGVDSVISGYTGGQGPNPDFESVSSGNSAYVQAVKVFYRPKRVGYAELLDVYWRHIDPTRADGQFSDQGPQYRTIIFYLDDAQKAAAMASRKRLEKSKRFSKPLLTEIAPMTVFYRAEPEHQDYYKKSGGRYRAYLRFSGREAFFKKAWAAKPGK